MKSAASLSTAARARGRVAVIRDIRAAESCIIEGLAEFAAAAGSPLDDVDTNGRQPADLADEAVVNEADFTALLKRSWAPSESGRGER